MTPYSLVLSFFLSILLTAPFLFLLLPSVSGGRIPLRILGTLILGSLLFIFLSTTIIYAYKGDLCEIILLSKTFQAYNANAYGIGNAYFGLWILTPILQFLSLFYVILGSGIVLLAVLIKVIYPYPKSKDLPRYIPCFSIILLVLSNRYAQQIFAVPRTAMALAFAAICVYIALSEKRPIFNKLEPIKKLWRYFICIALSFISMAIHPMAIIPLLPSLILLFVRNYGKRTLIFLLIGVLLPIVFPTFSFLNELYRGESLDTVTSASQKLGFWTPLSLLTATGMVYASSKHYYATIKIKSEYQTCLTRYINLFALLFSPFAIYSAFDNGLERFNLLWSIFLLLTVCNLSKLGRPYLNLLVVYIFISVLGSALLSTELSDQVVANKFVIDQKNVDCSLPLVVYSPIYHPFRALQSSYEAALRFDMTSISN